MVNFDWSTILTVKLTVERLTTLMIDWLTLIDWWIDIDWLIDWFMWIDVCSFTSLFLVDWLIDSWLIDWLIHHDSQHDFLFVVVDWCVDAILSSDRLINRSINQSTNHQPYFRLHRCGQHHYRLSSSTSINPHYLWIRFHADWCINQGLLDVVNTAKFAIIVSIDINQRHLYYRCLSVILRTVHECWPDHGDHHLSK